MPFVFLFSRLDTEEEEETKGPEVKKKRIRLQIFHLSHHGGGRGRNP